MPDKTLTKLVLKNFLATTRGSVDARLFQHLYVKDERSGVERDVLSGGEYACAYVVSSLLTLFELIDRPHATVATTIEKMLADGWQKANKPQPGAVVHWPEHDGHEHLGIVVGNNECVTNSSKSRTPILSSLTLSSGLKPVAFYVHPRLV